MRVLTYNKDNYDELSLNKKDILKLILKHSNEAKRIQNSLEYYLGNHQILNRVKKSKQANNKLVFNHAKDISDTACGYFLASPITFKTNDKEMDINRLTDAFDLANADDVDQDNALDMSRCGVAYEYVYIKAGETNPVSKNIEASNTFIVYDDTIEQNPLFGVYYYLRKDDVKDKGVFVATVATENYLYSLNIQNDETINQYVTEEPVPHLFGGIPIIKYQNNKDCIGDYEQQISLIDAYNTLMSDRINDKEQFLEALLVLYGSLLGDDEDEVQEALKVLRDNGFLELPEGAKAEYITRTFDEAGVEILKKALKNDIYALSHVPNLTDENFVGNSSGVAMEFKLLGLEMITRTKERYYTKGVKQRIRLFCNYLGMKAISLNPAAIMPSYSRALPKNLLELSQMIANLKGTVSSETLISQLDFVEDPEGELAKVKQENKDNIKIQQEMFNSNANTPPEEEDDEEDSITTSNQMPKLDTK